MKKIFGLMLLCATMLCFVSCEKENEGGNTLVGTKWYTSYSDYLMVLEFVSKNQVIGYFAKPNGVYYSGKVNGTYSTNGNSVTFSNMTYQWMYAYYKLEAASIDGSLLSTSGKKTFDIDSGNWYSWSETFSKQ